MLCSLADQVFKLINEAANYIITENIKLFLILQGVWTGPHSAVFLRLCPPPSTSFLSVAICIQWCLYFPSSPGSSQCQPWRRVPASSPCQSNYSKLPKKEPEAKELPLHLHIIYTRASEGSRLQWVETFRSSSDAVDTFKMKERPQCY